MEEDELDSRLRRSLRRGPALCEPEVVELAHRREAGAPELAVDIDVLAAHALGRLGTRQLEHRLAPGPEVFPLGPPAQGPLERVAVSVDEARDPRQLRHAREHTVEGPVSCGTWRPLALPAGLRRL